MITSDHSHGKRGQSLVELSISLMVILLLLSGAVDLGMALFSYTTLRDAAQEGALYGSMNPADQTAIRNRVRAAGGNSGPVDLSNFTDAQINIFLVGGNPCQGTSVTGGTPNGIKVTLTYDYNIVMPLLGAVLGTQTIPLTASVTDTILQPACQ
jgi:Flp pilus assembly protein TadG